MAHVIVHDQAYVEDLTHSYVVVKVFNDMHKEVGQIKLELCPDNADGTPAVKAGLSGSITSLDIIV